MRKSDYFKSIEDIPVIKVNNLQELIRQSKGQGKTCTLKMLKGRKVNE
ncbi:hypothetical protein JW813_05265 [Clostridium botulinum]|nr:hypothetical protein [Clostridium botulinum]UZP04418.1 hypothetical protein JW813_05265 [Clostridium botulinum]UZP07830.1 hypothetical protein JYA71_05540 [Clostridium botulinum]UZP11157.1 hypothetical protein JYA74_05260 [Clostridium botulinum]